MKRRLLNLLTALSLVLCVAACVLWVRSYRALDALRWTRADDAGGQRYSWFRIIASGRGRFACSCDAEVYELGAITPQEAARPTGRWRWEGWERGPARDAVPAFGGTPNLGWGFHFAWHHDPAGIRREGVVPYWAVALFTAFLPAGRTAARFRRGPGHRNGHCPRCGYDLRATPGRCPECGNASGCDTHMKRRLLNLLSSLSLLLCIAACVVWVRSYWRVGTSTHTLVAGPDVEEWAAVCGNGQVSVSHLHYRWNTGFAKHMGKSQGWAWSVQKPPSPRRELGTWLNRVGFAGEYGGDTGINPGGGWYVMFPLWLPLILSAVLPAARLYKRPHRTQPGSCARCGYDLRATPARCPECGTMAPAAAGG